MPARTGARSRAVDDRDRSSSSSDPGSAIEGFRQKIPFHNKLTDLGVKLGDLAIPTLLALGALFGKYLGELLDRLALPGRNLRRMQFVLGRQLRNRLVTLRRSSMVSPKIYNLPKMTFIQVSLASGNRMAR